MYVQKSGYCGYRGFQALSKKLALFCFFGQNPGARILRKFTREGTAVSSAPLLGICPPLGHSPFGPGRGDTAPFRAGRSPEHSGLCGARRAWAAVAGGTRGAGAAAQARPGAGTRWRGGAGRRRGRAGRGNRAVWARRRGGRAVPRAGAARGVWAKRGQIRAGGPGRGGGPRGLCRGGAALGAGPGRRAGSAAAQHAVSGGVCRVWETPSPCGTAARREGAFSLYKEARRSAGFCLSNQSCSGLIILCFRSGCFSGGAE